MKAAPGLGIGVLTLYAFSSDNWQRPVLEVEGLMGLLAHFFREESTACRDAGVRLTAIGRRDRLPAALRGAIAAAERITVGGDRLWLRVAIDYSSRDQILRAAEELLRASRRGGVGHRGLTRGRLGAMLGAAPDVDLLIRTGGERRLSDFLLWEAAYAELIFTEVAWPDFTEQHLQAAVAEFSRRDRRFGRVAEGRGA